jgi:iron complex outermembrane recepter protein
MSISTHKALCPSFVFFVHLMMATTSYAENKPPDDRIFEDVIVVTGVRPSNSTESIQANTAPAVAPDAAYLVSRLPGAALINNGRLSGQVQYRGAYGARVGTKINNQSFHSGGPNLMDPPMHYAPPPLVETIEVSRGASPVNFGPSLVGGVNTMLKTVKFGDSNEIDLHYDLTAIGRSADSSHALGGIVGVSNDRFKLFTSMSAEEGNDASFPTGDIENTFHERQVFGLAGGYRADNSEINIELRRQETGPTGNPPFAMDIKFVDTDFVNLDFKTMLRDVQLSGSIGYTDVDHGMTNYELRSEPPTTAMFRFTRAGARTLSADFGAQFDIGKGQLLIGLDATNAEMGVRITNPNNVDFYIDNLPDIDMDRYGTYGDWTISAGELNVSFGVRFDRHEAEAGLATTGPAVPMMAKQLAMQFNQSNRSWETTTSDLVARAWTETDNATWRASIAKKTRAPGYLERFAWLPTAASSGLADGNTYVGDLELDEETAVIFELGVDINRGRWWIRPSIYYHHVSDYIQGVAYDSTPGVTNSPVEMVSGMMGDPTPLRFANVDAKMYGIDADYGYQLSQRWRVEGVVSLVRGERRDISDDLYRISPDNARIGIIYERARWTANLETVLVDEQDNVSLTNNEQETSGHGLLNFYTHWQAKEGILVSMGLENVLDHEYQNHLGGYNRIKNSDVGLGERLPGTGRNVYLRLQVQR